MFFLKFKIYAEEYILNKAVLHVLKEDEPPDVAKSFWKIKVHFGLYQVDNNRNVIILPPLISATRAPWS